MTAKVTVPESVLVSAKDALAAFGKQADTFAVTVAAADPDNRAEVLTAMRSQHKDYAKVEALQGQIDALVQRIDEANESAIPTPSEAEVKAAETSLAELIDQAKPMINFLKAYGGSDWQDSVPASLLKKKKSGTNGTGTGKRPRLAGVTIRDTVAGTIVWQSDPSSTESEDKPSFTNAARVITRDAGHGHSVSVATLQQHAFDVAQTTDLSEVSGVVTFTVTVGSKHYEVEVEPKQSE